MMIKKALNSLNKLQSSYRFSEYWKKASLSQWSKDRFGQSKKKSHLINPYTKQLVSDKEYLTDQQIAQRISKLTKCQREWKYYSIEKKAGLLETFLQSIFQDSEYIKNILAEQIGKSFKDTEDQLAQLKEVAPLLIESGKKYFKDTIVEKDEHQTVKIVAEPVGLTLIFPHFSQPIFDSIIHLIPCLMSGSAALIKSSDYNHFLDKYLVNKIQKVTGLQIISDLFIQPNSLKSLAQYRSLKKLMYSGSQSSAKHIFQILAQNRFIDCNLFFGGQDAAYIDQTADLKQTIREIMNSSFVNNGQSYDCIKRLYIHEQVYDQIIQHLTKAILQIQCGDPKQKGIDLGPLATPEVAVNLEEMVRQAISYGAVCQVGGLINNNYENQSIFFQPTLLTQVSSEVALFQSQVPGPILSCQSVPNDQAFLKCVNDNAYGAGVRIFTGSKEKAHILKRYQNILDRIEVGKIVFNKGTLFTANGPIEGWKKSGKGKILSNMSFQEFTQYKVYNIKNHI